ncbi:MAG: sugar-binding protein [Kiritimatiellia bacterium]
MLKYLTSILLTVGLMSAAVAGPSVEARRFQPQPNWSALHMDGKLGDPFWDRIEPLGAFTVWGEQRRVSDDTQVKITFDDKWLYFGVECVNLESGFDLNTVQTRDGAVYSDDSVEIFISSDAARHNYCHFMLNCDNIKAEQKAVGSGSASQRERSWNPVWLSSAAKHERGWTAEIAIPLELLAEQGKVGSISFNITRTKIIPEFDSQGVRLGEKREFSALFPVRHSFHEPEAFGELRGLEGMSVQPGSRLKLDDVKVESFYATDKGTFYDVFAKISCGDANGEYADVAVRDLPAEGAPVEIAETRQGIVPGRQSNIRLSMPVAAMGRRDAIVILRDYFTKGTVEQTALTGLEQLTPLDAYFDRNYYTSEQYAGLVCQVTLPAAMLAGAQAALKDTASNELFRAESVAGENYFQVEIGRLPPGETVVVLVLEDSAGKELFQKALRLVKRAPKPGHEWKIDQRCGVLLKDGQPFFPVGLYSGASTPALMRAAKAAGVNVYAGWDAVNNLPEVLSQTAELDMYLMHIIETAGTSKKIAGLSEYLTGDDLKQADALYTANALQSILNYFSVPAFKKLTRAQRNAIFESFYQASLPEYLAGIRAVQDHPNLMVYETFDEPGFAGFDMFVQGRDLYKKTNETDGYHPTMALYSSHIPPGAEATDWCDILCTDPYWIPDGTLKDRSTVNFVSKIVHHTRQRADAARKMTWITLMGSNWSATHRRLPTPAEQMCQSYLAIIHGARGLGYYGYPQHKLLVDAIQIFIEQLNVLTPALLAPPVPQKIEYSPVAFMPEKDIFPAVQAALFRYPSGRTALLAANTIERQVTVDFNISGLPESGTVQRMFANGICAVSGGTFSDRLEPFGVRAYDLGVDLQQDGPVKILVRSAPDETVPPPARSPTVDYFGRKGMKNVAPNPSFEEATLPGLPDYLIPGGNSVIGYENSNMTLVENDPYHGRVCLQLINRKDDGPRIYTGFLVASAPQHPQPETYTWSIYIKGDTDGLEVLFGSHWMKEWDGNKWVATWKTVKVTKEWQRYSVTGPIPANVYRKCGLEFQLRGYGTVWVDAMQLEKGSAPTEFEP